MADAVLSADTAQIRALYRERAHLLALITAVLAPDAVLSYSDPCLQQMAVLHVPSPAGPMTWHIHPEDLALFSHLSAVPATDPRACWDGADKPTVACRLTRLTTAAAGSRAR